MKIMPAVLIAVALAVGGCATQAGNKVLQAKALRGASSCVAQGWLHDGVLSSAQFQVLAADGLRDYRRTYGDNPVAGPPDISHIERQCQNPTHQRSKTIVILPPPVPTSGSW